MPSSSFPPPEQGASLGDMLAAARRAQGRSRQEIARATGIGAEKIAAIESGELHRLPYRVFARGFVRLYAREVGVDEEEVLRRFAAEWQGDTTALVPPDSKAKGISVTAGCLVALLAAGIWFYLALTGGSGRDSDRQPKEQWRESSLPAPPAPIDEPRLPTPMEPPAAAPPDGAPVTPPAE